MNIETLTPAFWITNEEECKNYFKENIHWDSVPLITANNLTTKQKLVRFQGMIQDMRNPEYYYEKYEVVSGTTRYLKKGKYSDGAECNQNESIDYSSASNEMADRQTLLVVSVPQINDWVQEEKCKSRLLNCEGQSSGLELNKRPLTEEEASTSSANKRQRTDETPNEGSPNKAKNLPTACNKAYHVKVYDETLTFHLNDMVDVIGFLSEGTQSNEEENQMEVDSEVVPSIHCVMLKKITDSSPFVNETLSADKMKHVKNELQFLLTQLFMGDSMTAEYFIYNLISKIYTRNDGLPIGAFTLNISHVPIAEVPDFGEKLYQFIEILVPKSRYFPMTLANMNSSMFIPQKDYDSDKLKTGLLQTSDNTHMVLDETKLLPGRLEETGVKNVEAISNTIRNQTVIYDFKYYPMEYNCDIPFLVLSEGKSFLPCNYQAPLKPDQREINIYSDIVVSAQHFLNPQLLKEIRILLTVARHGTYEVSNEMQQTIQNDFVEMRQNKSVTSDDLHKLLTLARLICLSEGKTVMDSDCWKKACSLEEERKSRLQ